MLKEEIVRRGMLLHCPVSWRFFRDRDEFLNCEGSPELGLWCLEFESQGWLNRMTNNLAAHIGGHVVIEISSGCNIQPLVLASDVSQDITVLKDNDTCATKLKKWIANDPGACDLTPDISYVMELEGESDGDPAVKKEKLKKAVRQVLKFRIENFPGPEVPQPVDSLITSGFLERTSKDLNEYNKILNGFSAVLKPGGYVFLLGVIDATYIMNGNDEVKILKMTEDEVRDSFRKSGLIIVDFEVEDQDASAGPNVCNNGRAIFVAAHKPK